MASPHVEPQKSEALGQFRFGFLGFFPGHSAEPELGAEANSMVTDVTRSSVALEMVG